MGTDSSAQGEAVLAQLFGRASAETSIKALEEWDEGFASLIKDVCFGTVWSRAGLALKTRSLITVAALVAMGRSRELKTHMAGALALGASADELKEVAIHLSQYCGIPAASDAMRVLRELVSSEGCKSDPARARSVTETQ